MTRRQARISVRLAVLTVIAGTFGSGVGTGRGAQPGQTAQGLPAEGRLEAFLGPPEFDMQQVFTGARFPNVVVATDGAVLAFWSGVEVRRSEDGGKTWSQDIPVGEGFMSGGVTVDENSGDILAFMERADSLSNPRAARRHQLDLSGASDQRRAAGARAAASHGSVHGDG